MECTIQALLACFSLSGLYADGAVVYEDVKYYEFNVLTGERVSMPRNPLGRAALGYEIRLPRITFALEASHASSLATGTDRGINSLTLKARWYPFR